MSAEGGRHFPNELAAAKQQFSRPVIDCAVHDLVKWLTNQRDGSPIVYTGSVGVAYALSRVATSTHLVFPILGQIAKKSIVAKCEQEVRHAVEGVNQWPKNDIAWSLLCGHAGVFCTGGLILSEIAHGDKLPDAHCQALKLESKHLFDAFTSISTPISSSKLANIPEPADEILYGRAGYLLGALSIAQHNPNAIPQDFYLPIVHSIVQSGRSLSTRLNKNVPLYYEWPQGDYASPYLGAAHGLMGILYVLLHCPDQIRAVNAWEDVYQSVAFILTQECDSNGRRGEFGYYPTMLGGFRDEALVHWCHGSPGAVFLFAKAFEVYGEGSFLAASVRAGGVVWEFGLLKKGPGLCHGLAGNGYALLKLYRLTGEEHYLRKAYGFANLGLSEVFSENARVPDAPASLFEGWAGFLCFLVDLFEPANARFPFFEV